MPLSNRAAIAQWEQQRNSLVCQLLAEQPSLGRFAALELANERMGPVPRQSNPDAYAAKKLRQRKPRTSRRGKRNEGEG